MKVLILLLLMFMLNGFNRQVSAQNSCATAVQLQYDTLLEFQVNGNEFWGSFAAGDTLSTLLYFSPVDSTEADVDFIVVYDSNCANLVSIDTMFVSMGDSLLQLSGLLVDSTYYIKIHQQTSQTAYFGFALLVPGYINNTALSCPPVGCNRVPNPDFLIINTDIYDFFFQQFYSPPPPTAQYIDIADDPFDDLFPIPSISNICGWGKAYNTPQIRTEVALTDYCLHMWTYSSIKEAVYCEINSGQNLSPGNYIYRFNYRLDPNYTVFAPDGIVSGLDQNPCNNGIANNYDLTDVNTTLNFNGANWVLYERNFTITSQQADYLYYYVYPLESSSNVARINIDDVEIIRLTLTSTPSSPICQGVDVDIELVCPEIDDGWSISWSSSPTDPTMTTTSISSINAQPSTTTTYTVSISSPNGLVSTEDITITVYALPTAPKINGAIHTCDGSTQYAIQNYIASNTYTYEVTTGTGTSLISPTSCSSSFTINWNNYVSNFVDCKAVLTVYVDDGTCTNQTDVDIYECCTTGTYSWDDQNVSGTYTNQDISINGIVTVQNGYTLSISSTASNTITMGGNAKIYVESGGTVDLDGITIEACCDNMWNSIYLEDDDAYLDIQNCTIQHAKNAIISNDGGEFSVTGTYFDQNKTHINIGSYSGTHNAYLKNNTFDCSSNISLYPYSGTSTTNCIKINEVIGSIVIGDPSGAYATYKNTFKNAEYGIYSINSDITVRNNNFEELDYGVYFIGSANEPYTTTARELIVGGTSSNQPNTFDGMTYGIYAKYKANIDIYSNSFNDTYDAISINSDKRAEINVVRNTIENNSYQAIYVGGVSAELNIQTNSINTSSTTLGNTGIYATMNKMVSNPGVSIKTNICGNTVDYNYVGIYASDHEDLMISQNEVTTLDYPTAVFGMGIYVPFTDEFDIQQNYCIHTNAAVQGDVDDYQGIRIELSEDGNIRENDVNDYGSGLRPVDYCDGSEISCNTLDGSYYAVYFEDDAVVGDQGSANQTWDNSFPNNVNPTYNFSGDYYPSANHIWYYNNSGSMAISSNVTGIIFTPGSQSNPTYCSSLILPSCDQPPAAPLLPVQLDLAANREKELGHVISYFQGIGTSIGSSVLSNLYSSKYAYYLGSYAYRKLNENPAYLNLNTSQDYLYQQLYNALAATNIADMYDIATNISSGNLPTAAYIVSATHAKNDIETTLRTVYKVYLNSWAIDSTAFSSDDSATLLQLAYSDPADYGKGVFFARNMLGLIVNNNDDIKGIPLLPDQENESLWTIKVLPNPAKDHLIIEFNESLEGNATFTLFSVEGKEIMNVNLAAGMSTYSVSLPELKSGIYLYRITALRCGTKSGKAIINN